MPQTLAEYPQLHLARKDEVAYVYRRGFRTLRWTYGQVAELAFRFARELEAREIGQGDRVLLWGDNSAEWIGAFFGCMLRGAVAVPMDRIAAADFAQRVAADVDAKLVVCASALAEYAGNRPYLELENLGDVIVNALPSLTLPLHSAGMILPRSSLHREPPPSRARSADTWHILASVDPIEREFPKYRRSERLFHPIRFLELLPLSHIFGQFMGCLSPHCLADSAFPGQLQAYRHYLEHQA